MNNLQRPLIVIYSLLLLLLPLSTTAAEIPTSPRSASAIQATQPVLRKALAEKGMRLGSPIFIRIFKASSQLEVWIKQDSTFHLFKSYDICTYSGKLGPKTQEGDKQAPEGFYYVVPGNLNPWSSYHLAFDLGYPNAYDRAQGYTGSALMVHGKCVSIGCFAMTDAGINEIYTLAHAALTADQPFFRVHIFPFPLEPEILQQHSQSRWYNFWKNLQPGYEYFEHHRVPPNIIVNEGRYHVDTDQSQSFNPVFLAPEAISYLTGY